LKRERERGKREGETTTNREVDLQPLVDDQRDGESGRRITRRQIETGARWKGREEKRKRTEVSFESSSALLP